MFIIRFIITTLILWPLGLLYDNEYQYAKGERKKNIAMQHLKFCAGIGLLVAIAWAFQ